MAANRGAKVRTEARTEEAVEAILLAATEVKAGVIVVGSRGMERKIMGSVPNSIAHRAPCDVYIVQTV